MEWRALALVAFLLGTAVGQTMVCISAAQTRALVPTDENPQHERAIGPKAGKEEIDVGTPRDIFAKITERNSSTNASKGY